MPEEIIAAIKANPNIPMVTDQDVYQLIKDGKLDRDETINLLDEPRRSVIMSLLGDLQLQDRLKDRFMMIKDGVGITLEDMKQFILDYPNTPEASEVKSMIEAKKQREETMRYEACHSLADCKQFKIDYPSSLHILEIDKRILAYEDADDAAWREILSCTDATLRFKLEAYKANPNFEKHRQEADIRLNRFTQEEKLVNQKVTWEQAINQANTADVKLLSEFINDSDNDGFLNEKDPNMDITRRAFAQSIMDSIKDYPTIKQTIDNVLNSPDSDVDNYVYMMQKYPMFRDYIHDWMLGDMKKHAERYQRHEIYALLYGGKLIFSDKHYVEESISPCFDVKELLTTGILTQKQLDWIFSHPTIQSDYQEVNLPIEDNFKVEPNTTDVYFFGVPGCGKTSVLAGLFNAHQIDQDLTFKVLKHAKHKGYNYANSLIDSLKNDLFPKSTPIINQRNGEDGFNDTDNDDKFIQVIDALLTEKADKDTEHVHKISLIEMPGARTNELASIGLQAQLDILGTGAKELLSNDNNKIIFFVIDPKNTRTQPVNINGIPVNLRQSDTLDTVACLIEQMLVENQIKNLKAVHVIMAKSDLLPNQSQDAIKTIMKEGEYAQFMTTLERLCRPNVGEVNIHCDRQPHLFTFSLGRIAPGDFVKYNDKDTKKILKVICANTVSVRSKNFWDTFMTWMN